jgi:hypothetical protein
MTTVGAGVFAALLWGAIAGVAGVFVYELYAIAADAGLLDARRVG